MIIVKTKTQVHFINESRFEDIVHNIETREVTLSDMSRDYEGVIPNVEGVLYASPSNENNIESGTFFDTK